MPLSPGLRLGTYEILSPLGAGGMGEVYRAKDSKLGRAVAIKVLPESVAQDAERLARFEREARTLASLNHPNIVTIFAVEESGGTRFLAMELVEGESLDTIIAPGGLPLSRFFEITVPLTEALSAAHERGIVHRDLKPGNVMVTREGRVKVLDFGLAKLGTSDSDPNLSSSPTGSRANLTGEGQVFGTVAYMSPEQARGAAVDARSDVFSLGVVLYQMLTGERPFQGASAVDMISSILRDKPPSVAELRADLPPHLARVLRRCLEKDPRDRYQTSRDVYNELKELRAETSLASSAPSPRAAARPVSADSESGRALRQDSGRTRAQAFWIAVLPFTHSGADQELESFAEGLAEDINAGLAKFPYLSVISRNVTLRLKEQARDVHAGEQLGARYVVEGGIRKGASALRVNVQLVDTQTGAHLWAETYNRDLKGSDIFAVQDDITGRVVATVADSYGVLVRSMTAMIQQKADVDLAPSEWLFQYFAYRQQLSPPAHTAMKGRLEAAVERDAGQADLWACLAQVYTDEYAFGFQTDPTSLDRALAAARRAVELDRANQLGMVSLAQAYFFRQDLAAFRPTAEQAMALNRLNTDALGILGLLIVHTGEFERGAAIVRRAMELNPNHAGWFHFGPIWEHFHRGEYDRALEHAMQVNMPSLFWQPLVIAAISGQLDRRSEAAAAVRDLLALDPGFAAHARRDIEVWHFASGLLEPVLEGVRKGGLTVPETSSSPSVPVSSSPSEAGGGARPSSDGIRADEGFRVAVLPFKYTGNVAELAALAEGLTEDIVTGLSRFSYVRVIARSSTSSAAAEAADVRAAGKALGARYVMEGSVRQAGTKLRLAVQVVDATTGAHLWAENYERSFSPEAVFELQDDLVARIVSTVADSNGVLPRSMSEVVRSRDPEQLSPYEAVLRSFAYGQRVTPEELASARFALESAVRKAPAYADAWAMLAWLHVQDYAQGFNLQADSLASGFTAAQRAVEAAPSNPLAHSSLAQALFFQREFQSFRSAAERAVALNPMDGNTIAFLGELLTYAGEWERGLALSERAKQLNANHPGWYWYAGFYDAYRRGDYRGALGFARKVNLPGQWFSHAATAAAFGQLGERDAAAKAARDLLRVRPDFTATARTDIEKWWEPEYVEFMIDGWRKAGLEIAGETKTTLHVLDPVRSPTPASDAARADEGFWVAVLPFKHRGTDPGLEALAEGLTEDIGTGLSRFSYLRVIARSSTSRHANEAVDVRTAGKELGARYVMEGNLRQSGAKLRLAVQLVDAVSGAHLWAENYERNFSAEAVFELQDDLVPRIVSTVADSHGVLLHSMSEALRSRSLDQLSPYEAVLRSFGYFERVSAEELAAARSALELAVRKAPGYADAWAMLALLCAQEYGQGYSLLADSLADGSIAARRAVEAGPSNHLAHSSLAQVLFLQKEFQAFRNAAARAAALNPMDGATVALMGILLAYAGDWEHGCAVAEGAMRLNPHFPGWYRLATIVNAYRTSDYGAAIDAALRIQMPGYFWTPVFCAAAFGQLGERESARKALGELLAIRPEFGRAAREEFGKWHEPELVEHFIDGLRKAGLDVPTLAPAGPEATSAREPGAVAIAVLPFSDMSSAKDQEYLCEGMAEEIMNALVRIDGICVASRISSFRARRQEKDLAAIARALSVGHVLEGSVRTAGSRIRVTAQLTDVATGFQLWSERYDRDAADVFAVQDEIAAGVVEAVKARLAPGEQTVRARPQVGNLEAYRLYLKGRHLRYTKNDHLGALLCFEQAVALDPSHGPSWVGLADINVLAAAYGMKPSREAYAMAKTALKTAADLQGESAEALYVEGMITFGERRWKDSERVLARAIEIEPGHVQATCWTGVLLCVQGRTEEAIPVLERAREIDPLAPYPYAMTGMCLMVARRPQEADRFLDQALAFDEDNILALWVSGAAKAAQGLFDPAISRLERALTPSHRGAFIHGTLGWALAAAGKADDARRVLDALRSRPAPATTLLPEAWILAALGDWDGAFQVLDRACEEKQLLVVFTGLPGFDPLRSDPRFPALQERLGLPAEPRPLPREPSSAPPGRPSIVVLPFANLSPDADNEYFSDGLTEEIIADLSKVKALRVISRTSAMQLKGAKKDVRTIGRELNVRYVLEGGVRKAGTSLKITAQLIDVQTDAHLWSDKYSGTVDEVFEVQERVSREIVRALNVTLTSDEQRRLAERPIANVRAFELYLQARQEVRRMSADALDRATKLLAEAVSIEGETPPLLALMAWAKVTQVRLGIHRGAALLDEAEVQARALLDRAPDSAVGHALLGYIEYERGHLPEAVGHFKRGLEREPNDADALFYMGISYVAAGQNGEARATAKRIIASDPLSPLSWMLSGAAGWFTGRFDESLPEVTRGLELDPQSFVMRWTLGYTCAALGLLPEAARHAAVLHEMGPDVPYTRQLLALIDGLEGRKEAARERLASIDVAPLDAHNKFHLAESFGLAGDTDRALDVLEQAVDQGFYPHPFMAEHCPFLSPLRPLPRFAGILAKAKERADSFRKSDSSSS